MRRLVQSLGVTLLLLASANVASGQSNPFPATDIETLYHDLLGKINAIPLYDNHAHPGFADQQRIVLAPPT